MPQDNSLNFTTRVDLSGLTEGLSAVTASIQDTSDQISTAAADQSASVQASYGAAAEAATTAAATISDSFTQAMGEQQAAFEQARLANEYYTTQTIANAEAVTDAETGAIDIQKAAYLQLAEAQLSAQIANKLLSESYKQLKAGQLEESTALQVVANFERIAAEAAQQLRLAKGNLAEVTEFVAQADLQEAQATQELTAATLEATAATHELAAADAEEEVAQKSAISTRMIASAGLGELRGSAMGGTRAISALAASLPGMSAALEVAFPVIAAIALVEVLGQMATKVHAVYDEYVNLRSLQNATLKELTEADKESVRQSEERLHIMRETQVLDAELDAPKKGRNDVGAATGAAFDLQQDKVRVQSDLDNITAINDQKKILEDQSKQTVTRTGLIGPYTEQTDDARRATEQIKQLDQTLRGYVGDYDNAETKFLEDKKKEQLRVQEAGEKQEGNPDAKLLQQIEYEFQSKNEQAAKTTGDGLKPGEAASFWAEYLSTFQAGTTQAKTVLENYSRAVEENHKKIIASFKKLTEEQERAEQEGSRAVERGMAANNKANVETINDLLRVGPEWADYSRAVAQASIIATDNARAQELAGIKVAESEGVITKLAADQRIAALDTQNLTDKIKALEAELARLQEVQKTLSPGESGYEKNIVQQQAVMNQILKSQGQQTVLAITDNGKITQDITAPFTRAFQTINSQFTTAIAGIRNGTLSVSQAFGKMGIDILESVEDAFIKMVLVTTENELKMTIAHAVGTQARVAATTTGATETAVISKTSALEEIFIDAKVAAAGAYKALAGVPVVGPVLGAAAAGVTFAAVLALGAFEEGGIIPGSGAVPILGHGGERVLTGGQTSTFESFVQNMSAPQSSSATTQHVHYSPTINAYDGSGMRSALRGHSDDILDVVREGLKTGKLSVRG